MMLEMLNITVIWKPVVEILILAFVFYHIMLFFEGTRAVNVLRGIIIILLAFFLFQRLGLAVLDWMLMKLFAISVIAILIIFHTEIRQGLGRLGQRNFFGTAVRQTELEDVLKQLARAAENLSKDKIGALIAIEKNDPLLVYAQSGVSLDARVSSELIETIFSHNSILHDGGIIIQHSRIVAAGCLFPLTDKQDLNRIFGTRHRAALGLSEETDAVLVVISEERQDISLVYEGKLHKDLSREELVSKIKDILNTKKA